MWGTVPCPQQGGHPITGYRLCYSNGTSIVNTTGEGSRQHVLTGLTPFTSYSMQVAAVDDGGTVIQHSLWRHCRMVSTHVCTALKIKHLLHVSILSSSNGSVWNDNKSISNQVYYIMESSIESNGVIILYELCFTAVDCLVALTKQILSTHCQMFLPTLLLYSV